MTEKGVDELSHCLGIEERGGQGARGGEAAFACFAVMMLPYLDRLITTHPTPHHLYTLHRPPLVMFRRVGAGLVRWGCGTPASLPAAAASRPSTIITSSSSRSLSVLASSTRPPHSFLLAQHQHMPQQQLQPIPPSRGLSTSRDSSAAQHEAEAAEAAALEVGEDGLLEAPKPPRNSLVGVVVSDKMDKSIVVKVRLCWWVGLIWMVGDGRGGGAEARGSAFARVLCGHALLDRHVFPNINFYASTHIYFLLSHRCRV